MKSLREGVASAIMSPMRHHRQAIATRSKMPLHVFLRITRMDVCCGPPVR